MTAMMHQNSKNKIQNLEKKNLMQRPLPVPCLCKISPRYPPIITPPLPKHNSLPPPNYRLHFIHHNHVSPRHSQLPQLTYPPILIVSVPYYFSKSFLFYTLVFF